MIKIMIKPEHPLEPCFERSKAGGRRLTLLVLHSAAGQDPLIRLVSLNTFCSLPENLRWPLSSPHIP